MSDDRLNLDTLSPEDEDLLLSAVAEVVAAKEETEAKILAAKWSGFAAGRKVGRAERTPLAVSAEARKRRRDAGLRRVRAAADADPDGVSKLRRARLAKGYTQAELSSLVGVRRGTIGDIERSGRCRAATAARLRVALGTRDLGLTLCH